MERMNEATPVKIGDRVWIQKRTQADGADGSAFALGAIGIGVVLVLSFAAAAFFTSSSDAFWIHEGGVVETATVVFYAACLFYMVLQGGSAFLRRHPVVPIFTLVFIARELDFHKRFTGVGLFKIRFFTDAGLGLPTKAAGALVLVGLAGVCLYSVFRYWTTYWNGLRGGSPVARGTTVVGALIVFSKMIDGLDRNLASLGLHLSANTNHIACAAEEILELGIPLFGLLVLKVFFLRFRFDSLRNEESRKLGNVALAVPLASAPLPPNPNASIQSGRSRECPARYTSESHSA